MLSCFDVVRRGQKNDKSYRDIKNINLIIDPSKWEKKDFLHYLLWKLHVLLHITKKFIINVKCEIKYDSNIKFMNKNLHFVPIKLVFHLVDLKMRAVSLLNRPPFSRNY